MRSGTAVSTEEVAPPPLTSEQVALAARLAAVDPDLAISYRQVLTDIAEMRGTYVGPAGEIREVLRGTIAQLAPEADVKAQSWFVGHEGRSTHAERIQYATQQNRDSPSEQTLKSDEILDGKIGRLGRSLYERSSKALHAGTQQKEVRRIVDWVEVVLDEILP